MNLIRSIRLLLLMLFVLLQCVAPLAHAHVNDEHGEYNGQGVHIDLVDFTQLNAHHHHETDSAHVSVDEHQSAVVSMQPESRSSALAIDEPAAASKYGMFELREHGAVIAVYFYPPPLPLTPYQHPNSQAPPAQYS